MSFAIQTGTVTFSNPFGNTASVELTFPTAFATIPSGLSFLPALTGFPKNYPVSISYDPDTLTEESVTLNLVIGGSTFGKFVVGEIDCIWTAISGSGGGGSGATYTADYTGADFAVGGILTIPSSEHGCGNGPFIIQCYDANAPANLLEAMYTVNFTNGTIIVTDPATTGYSFKLVMTSI